MPEKYNTKDFIKKAKKVHKGKNYGYNKTVYNGAHSPITVECPKHGDFEQMAYTHLAGHGCKKCQYISVSLKNSKTQKQLIKEFKKIWGDTYNYSKMVYRGNHEYIIIGCKVDGHSDFKQVPSSHLRGHGCPKCATEKIHIKQLKTTEQFIKDSIRVWGENRWGYSKTDYTGAANKVELECLEHHLFFKQTPNNHLAHHIGCEKCYINSLGNEAIAEFLKNKNIKFEREYRFTDCRGKKYPLPFDFYLPEYKTCIEFDGRQHFNIDTNWYSKELISNDEKRNKYCKTNNITMIRIPHTKLNKLSELLTENLINT